VIDPAAPLPVLVAATLTALRDQAGFLTDPAMRTAQRRDLDRIVALLSGDITAHTLPASAGDRLVLLGLLIDGVGRLRMATMGDRRWASRRARWREAQDALSLWRERARLQVRRPMATGRRLGRVSRSC